MTWTADPARSQTITWLLADNKPAQVQYLSEDDYYGMFDGARTVTVSGTVFDSVHCRFSVTLTGLTPGVRYVYRVGRPGAWSEPLSFTTAADTSKFSFLYMGDVQSGYSQWGAVLDSVYNDYPLLRFSLLGGDLTDNGSDEGEWVQFLAAGTGVFSKIPVMPVRGNHDGSMYSRFFALPDNGPAGLKQEFYSFDYGNAHFVVLNSSNNIDPEVKQWLRQDLQNSRKKWKFAVFHFPAYPASADYKGVAASICANWIPILEQNRVDMVFVGHQHEYMRTHPLCQGVVQTGSSYGIIYVMGNAGSKTYAGGDSFDYIASEQTGSNYQIIDINGDILTLTAKQSNGKLIESYTIDKSGSTVSETDNPAEPVITLTGNGLARPRSFSRADLEAMDQVPARLYSTINTWPTKKMYLAEGVRLADILDEAGILPAAQIITITSKDGFSRLLTRRELEEPRYYYPGLKENHAYLGYIPGSPEGAEKVDNILALKSVEDSDDPHAMNSSEAPLLVLGQRWVTEQTNDVFVKNIALIEVSTTAPATWESPLATPGSGTISPGDRVTLSTADMNGDSIYYTTDGSDPTVRSAMYNWVKKKWWSSRAEELADINQTITINRDTTIKAIAVGAGKLNSEVAVFNYRVATQTAPLLTADVTDNIAGQPITISFADDQSWRAAITGVSVNGTSLSSADYSLQAGQLVINAGVLKEAGNYTIAVQANGYADAVVIQPLKVPINLSSPLDGQEVLAGQPVVIKAEVGGGLGSLNLEVRNAEGQTIFGPAAVEVKEGVVETSYTPASSVVGTCVIILNVPGGDAAVQRNILVKENEGGTSDPVGDVVLTIGGSGISRELKLTMNQLQAKEQYQHIYSAINTWPSKKWYVGRGVLLRDLLSAAGLKDSARLIKFISEDGYSCSLTVDELLKDNRYYFPGLMDNGSESEGHIPGSSAGAQEVETILALQSADGTDDPGAMNDLDTILLMMGQRSVSEQTGQLFVKKVNRIEVLTNSPSRCANPEADPASGEVNPGTLVRLGTADMDNDKIYYTTDGSTPTIDCLVYNPIASRWWSSRGDTVVDSINKPVEIAVDTVIKAITIGPGKKDSGVVTFSYKIKETVFDQNGQQNPVLENPESQVKVDEMTDIKGHWAQKNIEQLIASGAITGYPDGSFRPDNTISRAEFATVLVKAFQLENRDGVIFTDTANHWARDYIATAAAYGIIKGLDGATFGPDQPITREQIAVMLFQAAKPGTVIEELKFTDQTAVSGWARTAIASACQYGIMRGYPDNSFRPGANASRAEAVSAIMNALKISEKKSTVDAAKNFLTFADFIN